jgi:spermidine synthase
VIGAVLSNADAVAGAPAPAANPRTRMTQRLRPAVRNLVRVLVDRPVTPDVHDEDGVRCLRFNSGVVQSTMRLSAPFALELSYTRAMMGFLLFNAAPRDILVVGLGGGSLPKYCYRQFPQARITTLEIDPAVIALRDDFLIPPDDERFRIVQADGGDYLARSDVQTDVILLDGYDAAGLPDGLCSESFYADCRRALQPRGVLVANLWGGEPNRALYLDRLNGVFDGRVWWSRPPDSSGLIAFATSDRHFYPQWSRLLAQAQALGARHGLDLVRVVHDMRARPDPDA